MPEELQKTYAVSPFWFVHDEVQTTAFQALCELSRYPQHTSPCWQSALVAHSIATESTVVQSPKFTHEYVGRDEPFGKSAQQSSWPETQVSAPASA